MTQAVLNIDAESSAAAPANRRCPLCEADNSAAAPLACSAPPWRLKRCRACSMVYLENAPAYEALESDLAWEKTYRDENLRRHSIRSVQSMYVSGLMKAIKARWRGAERRWKEHQFILDHLSPGRILDVGSGTGLTLIDLPPSYVPYGIEVSAALAAQTGQAFRARGGAVLHDNALHGLDQFDAAFFDAIVMRAFLEHERQPLQVLQLASRALKPAGRILIKVPNIHSWNRHITGRRWCGFRFPDHVNYFTPRTLRELVTRAGFVIRRFALADRFIFSDNMWMIIERPVNETV